MRGGPLPSLPAAVLMLLGACAAEPGDRPDENGMRPAVMARATLLGVHVRAALACGVPLSAAAQDRAAAIESAALRMQERQGGRAARDAYLHALAPPAFDPRRHGRDRAAWCAERGADIQRVGAWLDSAEGAAFAQRAEAVSHDD